MDTKLVLSHIILWRPTKACLVGFLLQLLLACDSNQSPAQIDNLSDAPLYQHPYKRQKIKRTLEELQSEAERFTELRATMKLAYNTPHARPVYAKAHHFLAAQDYSAALPLLVELANQGYADAQFNLFVFYDPNNPGPADEEDFALALSWLERSVKQGYVVALTSKALEFYYGDNPEVLPDWGVTAELLLIAAEQGAYEAQAMISARYEQGEGVEQNAIEAYKWQRLSINRINASKNKMSEKKIAEFHLNAIVKDFKLTSTDIEKAEALAKQWEATHPWAYQSADELDSYSWSAPTDFPAPQEIVTAKPSDSR